MNGSLPSLARSGRGAALLFALAATWPFPARAAGDEAAAAANVKLQAIDDGLNETERSLIFVENEYVKKKDETDDQVRA